MVLSWNLLAACRFRAILQSFANESLAFLLLFLQGQVASVMDLPIYLLSHLQCDVRHLSSGSLIHLGQSSASLKSHKVLLV